MARCFPEIHLEANRFLSSEAKMKGTWPWTGKRPTRLPSAEALGRKEGETRRSGWLSVTSVLRLDPPESGTSTEDRRCRLWPDHRGAGRMGAPRL